MVASQDDTRAPQMIISCPSCSARYRVAEDKVQGRGARITCPTCAHKYVVYKGDGQLVVGQTEQQRPQGLAVTFARNGELRRQAPAVEEEDEAPTTLMAHGSTSFERRPLDSQGHPNTGESRIPAPAAQPAPPAQPAASGSGGQIWIAAALVAIAIGVGMLFSTLFRS